MTKDFITIKNASEISGKSIQTIRRMIKSKKIKFKKEKTPQGFNYLIDLEDMIVYYNIDRASTVGLNKEEVSVKETAITTQENVQQSIQPAIEFNSTLTKLIDQHSKEKENLFNLIENFQNKVVNLENQIKIERMNSKSWWKFW
ncbi:hypothetical protein HOJ01_01700 [bacterium]|jgi:hypothetical protein|nr:hypothetical protein [bacterium]MBT6293500.1 hypothetical protein [bacterium]